MRRDLPAGTVTFLFTDVEGSTKLLHALGADGYAEALAEHRRVIREACSSEGGVEVDTQGDAFFFAFPTAPGALAAAAGFTDALASGPISVRVGLHTGTPLVTEEGYVGGDVHFAARVAASAHGGQVVLSAATAEHIDGSLTDLGEHRLKDIEHAVPIYQLGNGAFPPLKTISNTNLPRPASSFVGREREVEEVLALLQDGGRLLTLTGPGGSGKTRLALEAAAELVPQFKAGVFWVGLAPLRDPALVTETIAQALGSKNGLQEHIAERELLLLLDNLEQVVDAAPELAALVEACPNLTLLCTSRELLRVRGEMEYPVLPLAEPEAVELFCARTRLEPTDEIAELCRRLDSLPLALELAAARTKVLSPAQILGRLSERLDLLKGGRDADPRQQTLRATIEWSYELLAPREQRLFARLSVFTGGCTLEAAEGVCEADLDTLQSLVEKGLLRFTNERYWMLETIREFAVERLEAVGEVGVVRRRHADRFLGLAQEAYPHLAGNPKEWLERLRPEHDNFRAALDRLETTGETQLVLQLAGALFPFWYVDGGHSSEALDRLERALAADRRPTAARARALNGAGGFAAEAGAFDKAARWHDEALALHGQLGDPQGLAYSTFHLGYLASMQRDFATARTRFEESREAFRAIGDEHHALLAAQNLAYSCEELGDMDRGRVLAEEVLERARATGNVRVEAMALEDLGYHAREDGRFEDALSLIAAGYRINADLGEKDALVSAISRLARVHAAAGRSLTAAQLLSSSEAHHAELGSPTTHWDRDRNAETLAIVRTQLDEAAFDKAWEDGKKLTAEEAVALALEEAEPDA